MNMTARQPRQRRRRPAPAASLPRPGAPEGDAFAGTPLAASERAARRRATTPAAHHREHHVTRDYSYVHKDLLTVAGVGAVVIAFIVAMSFVV